MRKNLSVVLLATGAIATAGELLSVPSSHACFAPPAGGLAGSHPAAFRSAVCAGPAQLPLIYAPRRMTATPLLAKRKRKGGGSAGGGSDGAVVDDEVSEMQEASFIPPSAEGELPMGRIPLPSEMEEEDAEKAIKKLVASRDTSLEAKFDIPREAIVEDNFRGKLGAKQEEDDKDAIFGLPGNVSNLIKKGTWACLALLVAAEVFARTPLADGFRQRNEQEELAKRREAANQGKQLKGVRPLKPYAFGDLSPPPPGIDELPGNQ